MNVTRSLALSCMAVLLLTNTSITPRQNVTRGKINVLDAQTELKAVTEHDGIVIVDFYADWCGPCKNLVPVLKRIAAKNPDVLIVKVNIEKHRSESKKHKVKSIPTLLFFKDGKLVKREVGFISEKEIQAIIKELQA